MADRTLPWVIALALLPSCANAPATAVEAPTPTPAEQHTMHRGHHGTMHHRFDDAEAWAVAFDDPARDKWQKPEAVIAKLVLAPDATVADIGAGTGYFAMRLARAVPRGHVLAADIEPDMVRYLTERAAKESVANLVAVKGTPTNPGLTQTVDLVFMCNTYHHVADRTRYFETVAASVADGGRLAIVEFSPDAPDDAPGPPKQHRIAPEVMAEELAAAGFEPLETDTTTLPYQYIAIFRAPSRP